MPDISTSKRSISSVNTRNALNSDIFDFSIIVCCYNSRARLKLTLQHLAALDISQTNCELIIVDNNSNDGTADYAIECWDSLGQPFPLKLVYQPMPGLIYARDAGLQKANKNLIVFVDDDNWLSPDYLQKAAACFGLHPNLGLLGGYASPVATNEFPAWFVRYQATYACGQQWPKTDFLTGVHFLWGAGLVGRLTVLKAVFDKRIPFALHGRKGDQLTSGDDDEINGRVWLLGYDTYYQSDLLLQHFIADHRLTGEYCARLGQSFNNQGIVRGGYFRMMKIANMRKVKKLFVLVKYLVAWIFFLLVGNRLKRRVPESYLHMMTGLGFFGSSVDHDIRKFYLLHHSPKGNRI